MKSILIIAMMSVSLINFAKSNEREPAVFTKIGSFVASSLTYPEKAIEDKKEGVVYVSFEVSEQQTVTNIAIEEGVSEELNQKAIEIVALLNLDETHFVAGKKFILPIKFVIK